MNSTINYNILAISYIYIFFYVGGLLFKHQLFHINELFYLYIGTLLAYNLYDLVFKKRLKKYNIYIQNIVSFALLLLFQNIAIMIYSNKIDITKILMYLFIFLLLDIILDVNIKDTNENKTMYMDILRVTICYYLVEILLKGNLDNQDYIYLIILILSKYFFHRYVDEELKNIVS